MSNFQPDEIVRLLIEKAIAKGRTLQSPQTGFLHHFYHSQSETLDQTIPLVENVYFILALMRSKTVENIKEAKDLLSRLLSFKKENFPVYLHEYPECKDYYLGASLLPSFYWILKDFQTILGKELLEKLQEAAKNLAYFLNKICEQKLPPYHIALKSATSWIALGRILQLPDLDEKGQSLLNQLKEQGITKAWGDPHYLAEILASLQMIYPKLSDSPWAFFWEYLCKTWHAPTACFSGPSRKVFQVGFQPEMSLYDLYFAFIAGSLPNRASNGYPYELLAALVQPPSDSYSSVSEASDKLSQQNWLMLKKDTYAYCFLENDPQLDPSQYNGYHFLRLVWGDTNFTHSFVCQKHKAITDIACKAADNKIELDFLLEGEVVEERGDLDGEVIFYADLKAGKVLVDEVPATTFDLSNQLKLITSNLIITLKFVAENPDDLFFGHIHRGNRPAQIGNKGLHKYEAYDLKIFIRPIKRTSQSRLKAYIQIEPCQQ